MLLFALLACRGDPGSGRPDCLAGYSRQFRDQDGDGHGDPSAEELRCGALQPGYALEGDDCAPYDPTAHPGAAEECDGEDDDCDGEVDDHPPASDWYADEDSDGFGDPERPACGRLLFGGTEDHSGQAHNARDCDDADRDVNPKGREACNGKDDDCDGTADADAIDGRAVLWPDADGDGGGDPLGPVAGCRDAPSAVIDASDCDDRDPAVNVGATEVCGGGDEDCDGLVDGHDPDVPAAPGLFLDRDGDGLGDRGWPAGCPGPGVATNADDCRDDDPLTGAGGRWRADLDGDGVGAGAVVQTAGCTPPPGSAAAAAGEDCDDADPARRPGAPDACGDGADQDCDGHDDPCGARTGGVRPLSEAGARIVAAGQAGSALSAGADVDGDGLPDVLLADPQADPGGTIDAGVVYLVSGAPAGEVAATPWVRGAQRSQRLFATAAVDLSGDGRADLVVGGSDGVHVLRGPVAAGVSVAAAERTAWGAGQGFAPAGDVDGDGLQDLWLTDVQHGGVVLLWPGSAAGDVQAEDLDAVYDPGPRSGVGAPSRGDVDGDGLADLLVAADLPDPDHGLAVAAAVLLLGPTDQPAQTPDAVLSAFDINSPVVVAADGDADGDGRDDLVAAMWNRGAVAVTAWPTADGSLLDGDALLVAGPRERLGLDVRFAGDLDGDGADELLVTGEERIYVASGPFVGTVDLRDGDQWTGASGPLAVADLDGNGATDLVVADVPISGAWVVYEEP